MKKPSHFHLVWSALACSFFAASAGASVIDVSGTVDTGQTINADQAVAVSFTLTETYTNVSIGAPIECIGCTGGVFLHSNELGAGTTFTDTIDAQQFDAGTSTPFFSGLTLVPDTYFLIINIDAGFAVWSGSFAPTTFVDDGAVLGPDFSAMNLAAFVPFSDFGVILGEGQLHYNVDGQSMSAVPVPAAAWLMISGLMTVFGLRLTK